MDLSGIRQQSKPFSRGHSAKKNGWSPLPPVTPSPPCLTVPLQTPGTEEHLWHLTSCISLISFNVMISKPSPCIFLQMTSFCSSFWLTDAPSWVYVLCTWMKTLQGKLTLCKYTLVNYFIEIKRTFDFAFSLLWPISFFHHLFISLYSFSVYKCLSSYTVNT